MLNFLYGITAAILMAIPLYLKIRRLERAELFRDLQFKAQIQRLDERYDARDKALIQLFTTKLECAKEEQLKAIDTRLTELEDKIIQHLKAPCTR